MDQRGLHTDVVEQWHANREYNEAINMTAPEVKTRLQKNLETIEMLDSRTLDNTRCIETTTTWTPSGYLERRHLDINNTLNLLESIEEESKSGLFSDLIEDFYRLKRICNDEIDYHPVIEDVPGTMTPMDLFPLIAEELSIRGQPLSRGRGRERTHTMTYGSIER
jgi:hypothetical protein